MEYKGLHLTQAKDVFEVFRQFFENEKFDRIIEFGTGLGGLTLFLSEITNSEIYSFDKFNMIKDFKIFGNRVAFEFCSIFGEKEWIGKLIISEGRVLILCDNGCKVNEVNTFSKYLKMGDVIMAHDYFESRGAFDKKLWKSCEIVDKDVADKSLKPFYVDLFKKVFWLCRIK